MLKKNSVISILLLICILFSFSACGNIPDGTSSSDPSQSQGTGESSVPEYILPENIAGAEFNDVIHHMTEKADKMLHSGETVTISGYNDYFYKNPDYLGPAVTADNENIYIDTSAVDKSDLSAHPKTNEFTHYDNIRYILVLWMMMEYYDGYYYCINSEYHTYAFFMPDYKSRGYETLEECYYDVCMYGKPENPDAEGMRVLRTQVWTHESDWPDEYCIMERFMTAFDVITENHSENYYESAVERSVALINDPDKPIPIPQETVTKITEIPESIDENSSIEEVIYYSVAKADRILHSGETLEIHSDDPYYIMSIWLKRHAVYFGGAVKTVDDHLLLDTASLDKSDLRAYPTLRLDGDEKNTLYDNIRYYITLCEIVAHYKDSGYLYEYYDPMQNSISSYPLLLLPECVSADNDTVINYHFSLYYDQAEDGIMDKDTGAFNISTQFTKQIFKYPDAGRRHLTYFYADAVRLSVKALQESGS